MHGLNIFESDDEIQVFIQHRGVEWNRSWSIVSISKLAMYVTHTFYPSTDADFCQDIDW